MKQYEFKIVITEDDISGDEFWEEAIKKDGTGIQDLTEVIKDSLQESNLFLDSDLDEIVTLTSFKEVEYNKSFDN